MCLNYTQSDVQDYFRKVFSAGKNEAGFSKLEVVPISHLLDGKSRERVCLNTSLQRLSIKQYWIIVADFM